MPGTSKPILIVEDEVEINDLIAAILTARGYEVLQAFDGHQALRLYRLHANELSLVLCDISLPAMSGLDFLRASVRQFGAVPVVMLSGHDDVAKVAESVRLGAVDFVTKPTALVGLVGLIPRWQEAARRRATRSETTARGTIR